MRVVWFVGVAACSFAPSLGGTTGGDDDAAVDPGQLRIVTFANAASTTDLLGFPVVIPIGPTDVDHAQITDPTTQLRFRDPDSATDLPFEIDRWDAAGESLVWVRVPKIDAGSTTDTIELRFGTDVATAANAPGVWAGYDLVQHLDAALADSTGNGHTGDRVAVVDADGQLGGAQQFSGGSQRITFASSGSLFDGWPAFTLELWLRLDYATIGAVADDSGVIDKGGPMSLGRVFTPNANTVVFQTDFQFDDPMNGTNGAFENTGLSLGTWTHLAYSYDGQRLRMFANGAQVRDEAHPSTLTSGNNGVLLGSGGNGATRMTIDEVRISQTPRDLDWLRAQHLAMTRQFVTISTP